MTRYSLWLVALVAVVACALFILRLSPSKLTFSELNVGNLPRVPMQASAATVECTRGLVVNLESANGEWSVIQDHPPCTVIGIFLLVVKATADEMRKLNCRPLVSFEVAPSGLVSDVKLVRSSGSTTLDEKAVRQIIAYRYPRHNCGMCKMSISMNVDFRGPVWMREPATTGVRPLADVTSR
jgi:TonB family protein